MPDEKDKSAGKFQPGENRETTRDVFELLKKAISGFARQIQSLLAKNKPITWYYEEKHCPAYSMEAAIKWFKENRPAAKTDAAGVYRVAPEGEGVITLYLFFLEGETPMLDGDQPCLVVKTSALDALLKSHFEQKDLVILK